MKHIGIIGAGNIGAALARLFRAAGHDVVISNSRGPASLSALAKETGARAVTVEEAVQNKDVVVVTIPLNRIPELPKDLFASVPAKTVVIDTCNYYPRHRDGRIAEIEEGMTESEWVAAQLQRPVIKVFNSIYAAHLLKGGKPEGTPKRIALAISGDDAAAKATVTALVNEIGFDVVDDGPIANSWRQQPGSPVYCQDFDREGVQKALAAAKQERAPEWKASDKSPGTFEQPA